MAGKGNCLYYSPLQSDLSKLDPSLIHNLQTDVYFDYKREYYLAEAVFDTTLATINGHDLAVAVGGPYRREKSSSHYSGLLLNGFAGFLGKRLNKIHLFVATLGYSRRMHIRPLLKDSSQEP